jgi:hypothetical protein
MGKRRRGLGVPSRVGGEGERLEKSINDKRNRRSKL